LQDGYFSNCKDFLKIIFNKIENLKKEKREVFLNKHPFILVSIFAKNMEEKIFTNKRLLYAK